MKHYEFQIEFCYHFNKTYTNQYDLIVNINGVIV